MRITVFVPAPESAALASIRRGSGIVAREAWEDLRPEVQIDYEGNLYGAVNLETFANRVRRAWERQERHYPTVARMFVPRYELVPVGWFDPEAGVVNVNRDDERLAEWLEVERIDPNELRCSS